MPVPAASHAIPLPIRDLGARGSRAAVADVDPSMLTERAAAVLAAVPQWWSERATEAGLTGRWLDVTWAVDAPAPSLGGVEPADWVPSAASGEALGGAYVEALTTQVRSRHGRHYTPGDLAEHLWAMARRAMGRPARATRLTGLIRDPACGAGALLLPAVREHVIASVKTEPAVALAGLPNLVEGIDSDPAAAWLASVILAAEVLPLVVAAPTARKRPLPALARVGDGLGPFEAKAAAVVMNPPYGRVRLTDEERRRWEHVLYGHANLYGLFMGAALEQLDADGVLAALVPTSFTSGLYFSRLRETLSERAPLRETTFVAARGGVFNGVLQETCLAVFTGRRARRTTISSMNGHVSEVARVKSPRGPLPWLLPRRGDDAPTAAAAADLPLRLSDVGYRCSTGPLVWNRRSDDLHARNAEGRVPVIWAADIDGGELHRDRARDRLRHLTLRPGDEKVLVLDRPAVLVQRTTAPEQTRRLVVAELTPDGLAEWGGRVIVENHVNVLRPTVTQPLVTRRVLAAILATDTLDRVMRSLSGSVAVSAYELEALPLPPAEVLQGWDDLPADRLRKAVADAYRPPKD